MLDRSFTVHSAGPWGGTEFFFSDVDFIFQSSLRFTAELSRNYGDYGPHVPKSRALPSSPPFPTMIHLLEMSLHCYLKKSLSLKVYSLHQVSLLVVCLQPLSNDTYAPVLYHTEQFHCPQNLCTLTLHLPPALATIGSFTVSILCLFRSSCSWIHIP